MAFIPISLAHQTRWHKTKTFPPRKRQKGKQTLFPSRRKSESIPILRRKVMRFGIFLLHKLNMLGSKQKVLKVAAGVTLGGVWQSQVHFGWVVTIHHSPHIHHGPFIIHVLSLRSHPFIYSLCSFSFYKTAIHICSLCELAMGRAVSKVFGKDKRKQHEVKRTPLDWAALTFSKTVSK